MSLMAPFLEAPEFTDDGPPQSPPDWKQIEDPGQIEAILAQLQSTTRNEVYACAEEYELAYPGYEGDRAYYVEKAGHGRVLYLGVGTGRLFAKIAAANSNVVGIDNSPEMLRLLRQRHPEIANSQILFADAAHANLPANSFDAVVAPYSFLQVLDAAALPLLLRRVERWLTPGGQFHTDVFSPYLIPFRKKGLEASVRTVQEGTRVAVYIVYEHLQQTVRELALVDSPRGRHLLEMRLRYYFPQQLIEQFRAAGLPEPTVTGGYRGEPFDPTANEILVLETRKPPRAAHYPTNGSGNHAPARVLPPRGSRNVDAAK